MVLSNPVGKRLEIFPTQESIASFGRKKAENFSYSGKHRFVQ
jgi:hypothetical protein